MGRPRTSRGTTFTAERTATAGLLRLFVEVDGDLACGVAKTYYQHALSSKVRARLVGAAMQDLSGEGFETFEVNGFGFM